MNKLLKKIAVAMLLTGLTTGVAQAECYFTYKAKKENPLQLHYGVIRLDQSCSEPADRDQIATRIAKDGWTLLVVSSPVPQRELNSKKEEAGEYFLRY